jgi:hypothetical protein
MTVDAGTARTFLFAPGDRLAPQARLHRGPSDHRVRRPGCHPVHRGPHRWSIKKFVRSLERLGYKVTIEPVDPETGELTAKAG